MKTTVIGRPPLSINENQVTQNKIWKSILLEYGPSYSYSTLKEAKALGGVGNIQLSIIILDDSITSSEIENYKSHTLSNIVLVGSLKSDDQHIYSKLGVFDWLPTTLDSKEIEQRTLWYIDRLYNPQNYENDLIKLLEDIEVKVSGKEKEIVKHLVTHETLSRQMLYKLIWNNTNVTEKTLDVHLCNLRKKLRRIGKTIQSSQNGQIGIVEIK